MITPVLHVFEELSDRSRRKILICLLAGQRNVSEIVEATGLRQPNASNHLARMRTRGIVRASRIGRQVYYALATREIEEAVRSVLEDNQEVEPLPDFNQLANDFAKAAIKGDEKAVEPHYQRLLRSRVPIVDLYEGILAPAMRRIGNWYLSNEINEAQEHLASEITARMMGRAAELWVPSRENGLLAILGNAADNWHALGLRMVGDLLRSRGWTVLFLGANVPTDAFVEIVEQREPDVVLLSCLAESGAAGTRDAVAKLARLKSVGKPFVLGVGGTQFKQGDIPGSDFCCESLRDFSEVHLPRIEKEMSGRNKF